MGEGKGWPQAALFQSEGHQHSLLPSARPLSMLRIPGVMMRPFFCHKGERGQSTVFSCDLPTHGPDTTGEGSALGV